MPDAAPTATGPVSPSTTAPPTPAADPTKPVPSTTPAADASGKAGGHQETAPAGNPPESAEAAWLREMGFTKVKRADGKDTFTRKVKADGAEFDFDLGDPESWNGVSTTKAAKRLINQATGTQKKLQDAWDNLRADIAKDPVAVLEEFLALGGKDSAEVRKQIVAEELRRAKLSPEQRRVEELEAEKRTRAEEDQRAVAEHQQRLTAQAKTQWNDGVRRAMADAGLADEPETAAEIFGIAFSQLQAKRAAGSREGVDVSSIAKSVRNRLVARALGDLGKRGDAELLDLLGPEMVARVRKLDAARVVAADEAKAKAAAAPPAPTSDQRGGKAPEAPAKPKTMQEKREWMQRFLNGGTGVPTP